MHTALLVFSVKDKDLFGMSNQYLAECYLSFEDIENSQGEQIHMKLSRPIYKGETCYLQFPSPLSPEGRDFSFE